MKRRGSSQLNLPLKYQMDIITKLVKSQLKADILLKSETKYVDVGDVEELPIHTSGKITFKERDLEGRKSGYFLLVDVSTHEFFPPIELIPIIGLAELEGKHLVVLTSLDGNVFKKHGGYFKEFFMGLALNGSSTIKTIELKKDSLIKTAKNKVSDVLEAKKRLETLNKDVPLWQQEKRVLGLKRVGMEKRGVGQAEMEDVLSKYAELEKKIKKALEEIPRLEQTVEEGDVPDLISSDEEGLEELAAELEKKRKKIPLTKEQLEESKKIKLSKDDPKNGDTISLEMTDESSDTDNSYESSSSEEEEEEEEEIDNYDDPADPDPTDPPTMGDQQEENERNL